MPTKLIRGLNAIMPDCQGGVLTIGNFDGVHAGHQELIAKVIAEAKMRGVPSMVMTFEPHPFEFFSGDQLTIPRLTRLREKFRLLTENAIDYVLVMPFNQDLANLSASDFVTQVIGAIQPVHIVIGDDFRFGCKRLGDAKLLTQMGETARFTVSSLPTITIQNERVSSTRVRKALLTGDHELAERLLSHPYTMLGRVGHGNKLGRELGFHGKIGLGKIQCIFIVCHNTPCFKKIGSSRFHIFLNLFLQKIERFITFFVA